VKIHWILQNYTVYIWIQDTQMSLTPHAWLLNTSCVCNILQNMERSRYRGQKYKVCLNLQFLQPFCSFQPSFKACSCIHSKCGHIFYRHTGKAIDFPLTDQQADSELPGQRLVSIFSKLRRNSVLTSITNVKLMVIFHCCGQTFKSSSTGQNSWLHFTNTVPDLQLVFHFLRSIPTL
jgi:hypothetical protein